MKKIVFGLLAFSGSVLATTAIAAPMITTAPAAQSLIQKAQHFGWPDRPGGPGGWSENVCDGVQQMCAQQWIPGGQYYNRCMVSRGC